MVLLTSGESRPDVFCMCEQFGTRKPGSPGMEIAGFSSVAESWRADFGEEPHAAGQVRPEVRTLGRVLR